MNPPGQLSLRLPSAHRRLFILVLILGLVSPLHTAYSEPKDRWTELNIGPFYLTTNSDVAAARNTLTQLEQLRWVMGNLLESKELASLWPIRVMLVRRNEGTNPALGFVFQNSQYLVVTPSDAPPPLAEVAGLLLDANTPRLPAEVESGMRQLFSSLQARGSRVTWGGPVAHPDLAWARMQLFATKFEYGGSFHIFLSALKGGSTLAAAERNAFGKSVVELEAEAKANLAAGNWTAVPVSGRPLDPKRDFGEHILDPATAEVYLADWKLSSDPKAAGVAYKSAVESGGPAIALGYEGLGQVARLEGENPRADWDNAIRAGSRNATVYLAAADDSVSSEALPLLKRAAQLNTRWAVPLERQAQLATNPADKAALLKEALKLDPRSTSDWIALAKLQTASGEAGAAQGSWLRAEEAATDETERDRVHQMRVSSEQQRLDAAEERQSRERNAPYVADAKAQRAEERRIRAAERKANQSLNAAAGVDKPSDVVPWNSLAQQKRLSGTLTRVDCLKSGWRLSVKDKDGKQTALFLDGATNAHLACGPQSNSRHISVEYSTSADEDLQTAGEITTLEIR